MPSTNLRNSIDFEGQKFYVGLDVHKKSWSVTVRCLDMQVARFTQPPSAQALAATLRKKFPGGVFYSAYEAGFCGTSNHEQLCRAGIANIVVHAADIPRTDQERKNKTDLHDSRTIAQRLEKNQLNSIHILSREQQELRSLFRLRESKVKDVVRAINRLKGHLMFLGIEIPDTVTQKESITIKVLKWLDNLELASEAGTICLKQYMEALKYQRAQLCQITKLLRNQMRTIYDQPYKRLLTVPGIGSIISMAFLAEIGDFSRFDDPDSYCSYLGLTPWNDSTGENIRTKGIQPRCNRHLRPLIIEASWTAIRNAPELLAYYRKHASKNNKHAIIKVARRLVLIARAVVLKNQDYQSDYLQKLQNETSSEKTKQQQKSEN
jgi:transposase